MLQLGLAAEQPVSAPARCSVIHAEHLAEGAVCDDLVALDLRAILADAQNRLERSDDARSQRHILLQMLGRIAKLANGDPGVESESHVEPIMKLGEALRDLDRGRTPELLKPSQIDSRPINPDSIRYLHGMAGGCLELGLQQGLPSKLAGATIAKALNEAGYRLSTGPVGATTASSWRKSAKQSNADQMMFLGFSAVIDGAKSLGGSLENVFELAVDALTDFVATKRLEQKPPS